MQSRYSDLNNIKKNDSGKRVYSSIFYPSIEEFEGDVYIITKETDRMDLLAWRYYGDSTLWWIIAHCNKIKGGLVLSPNMQIRIPMNTEKIIADFKELNQG